MKNLSDFFHLVGKKVCLEFNELHSDKYKHEFGTISKIIDEKGKLKVGIIWENEEISTARIEDNDSLESWCGRISVID